MDPVQDSATYMARVHGIDRRKHTRVRVPAVAIPLFPYLNYNQVRLPLIDVSIGGACINDLKQYLTGEVGHTVRMDLCWPKDTETLDVCVIAASRHTNRHLKFQNISPGSLARLSMLVRSGSAGQKMRLAPSLSSSVIQLQATELWTGVNGDSVTLFDTGEKTALVCCCATTVAFYNGLPPQTVLKRDGSNTRPALPVEVADALICLVNIENPSPRVSRLIMSVSSHAHQWAKTGTEV